MRLEDYGQAFCGACVGGALFGLGLLTKDMTVFVTLLPLGVCWLFDWCLPRRSAVLVAGAAVLLYLPYPVLVLLSGDGAALAAGKLSGLARLIGMVKSPAFDRRARCSWMPYLPISLSSGRRMH